MRNAVNLLTDPIITVRTASGIERVSLPRLFVLLMGDAVREFPALRPHQAPAWHAFLVQLATLATEGGAVPDDAAGWAAALRRLTPDWPADEPWSLVARPDAPALLQPAIPAGGLKAYGNIFASPDELDTLVTAKNHDLKSGRMRAAAPEEWLFALATVQATEGYGGKSNYGVMRMNGGYGSRTFLGIAPAGGSGARFRRDLDALRRHGSRIFEDAQGFGERRQAKLLWLEPWDGKTPLDADCLHPLCLEICRRLRLEADADGTLSARGTGTAAARVAADELKGLTGDPWTPVEAGKSGERKALSITGDGFGWRRMAELIFGAGRDRTFQKPLMARVSQADGAAEIVAAALARGQGKTEGFHSRRIPVTEDRALRALAEEDAALRDLAATMTTAAGTAASRCLRPALFLLFQKGPERVQLDRRSTVQQVEPWMQRLDARIDAAFFAYLWRGAGDADAALAAERIWSAFLHTAASAVFEQAAEAAPSTEQRRLLAAQKARDLLRFALRKNLPLDVEETADG